MGTGKQKQRNGIWMVAVVLSTVACGRCVAAQEGQSRAGQSAPLVEVLAESGRVILVSIPDRKLVLIEGGMVKRVYPVAVGKPSTPSPAGQFTIVRQVSNPSYAHKGKVVNPGPKNPVGSRWMGLNRKGYGIHGTNEPDSIGKAASHGCIRMSKGDLEELYAFVRVGDAVDIHAQHDAMIAMVLGEVQPIPSPQLRPIAPADQLLLAINMGSIRSRQAQ
jgi:hypothetical protein